jgi:hypothetical protein
MKPLPIVAIIGVLLVGGYFVVIPESTIRGVIFQCEEMWGYYDQYHLYLQFLNNGFSDVVLTDSQIKLYFKTPENTRILIGSEAYPSIIQLQNGKMVKKEVWVDMNFNELISLIETRGLYINTESGLKFYQDSDIIIEMTCTGHSQSWSTQVIYIYSMNYFDVRR